VYNNLIQSFSPLDAQCHKLYALFVYMYVIYMLLYYLRLSFMLLYVFITEYPRVTAIMLSYFIFFFHRGTSCGRIVVKTSDGARLIGNRKF